MKEKPASGLHDSYRASSYADTVSTGSPIDMNVERSRRLAPVLEALELEKADYHAFHHFNVSLMDALRVPLKTIHELIGHALTGSFTMDVYGHALDWKANEDAAKGLGEELARAVTEAESSLDSGYLTAHPKKISELGIRKSLKTNKILVAGVGFEPTTFGL